GDLAVDLRRIVDVGGRGAVLVPERHEARPPTSIGAARDRKRFGFAVGQHQVTVHAELRIAAALVGGAIALDLGAHDGGGGIADEVHAGLGGAPGAVRVDDAVPQRWVRLPE